MRSLVRGFSFLCLSGSALLAQPSNPTPVSGQGLPSTNQTMAPPNTPGGLSAPGAGASAGNQSITRAGAGAKPDGPEWAKWAGNGVATINLLIVCYIFIQTQ